MPPQHDFLPALRLILCHTTGALPKISLVPTDISPASINGPSLNIR